MTGKEQRELDKLVKEYGYNDELIDLYIREILDQEKEYGWDQNFRPNILLATTNILLVIRTFTIALMIAPISNIYQGENLCIKYLKLQIDRETLIKRPKIIKHANSSSICDSILKI